MKYEIQTTQLNDAVWIHASDGSTVGRFGKIGIDLHNTITEQMAGSSQCRLCTHRKVTADDWELFKDKAFEWWGVIVPNQAFDADLFK